MVLDHDNVETYRHVDAVSSQGASSKTSAAGSDLAASRISEKPLTQVIDMSRGEPSHNRRRRPSE